MVNMELNHEAIIVKGIMPWSQLARTKDMIYNDFVNPALAMVLFQRSWSRRWLFTEIEDRTHFRGLRNSEIRFGIRISETEPGRTELFMEFRKSRNSGKFGIPTFFGIATFVLNNDTIF